MMERPLAFIDVETTGTDVAKDRIIQVGVLKVYDAPVCADDSGVQFRNGDSDTFSLVVNPGRAVPDDVQKLTGISQAHVDAAEPFVKLAIRLADFLLGCDLVGFNINNFDVPILVEEMLRSGVEWAPSGLIIDAGIIFKKKEERTLSAAMRYYCGRDHEQAHEAMADATATAAVFFGQMKLYPDLRDMDRKTLADFSRYNERVDFAGKLTRDKDGEVIYNLGKSKGVRVKDDQGMAYWMLDRDFPLETKRQLRKILEEITKDSREDADKQGMPF